MNITKCVRNDIVFVAPKARLSVETVADYTTVLDRLLEAGSTKIVLDLGDVPSIDGGGLGGLVQSYLAVKRRKGRIVLIRVGTRNKTVLVITKLVTVFEIYENEEEAERSFLPGGGGGVMRASVRLASPRAPTLRRSVLHRAAGGRAQPGLTSVVEPRGECDPASNTPVTAPRTSLTKSVVEGTREWLKS